MKVFFVPFTEGGGYFSLSFLFLTQITLLEAFSLLEVNQYIKRVLALNFEEAFWVECELNQVSHSRGNVYLELIQKAEDSDEVLAKNSAQIWYRKYLFIKKKLGKLLDSILKEGIKVKLKVNVNYSERYGLSLVIDDIDPAYTFGQFELNRQKTIEQLKQKGLLDTNAALPLPSVIQKIAVISSATAAGYQDFRQQLEENPYGYKFEVQLFASAMQGQNTERDVVAAIVEARAADYDLITIIRGGGSKLDLSAFDNYNIAFEIAVSEMPVVTGIGHDIDQTVCDIVAHTVLKTPTAVADMIIEHNTRFESDILQLEGSIWSEVLELITTKKDELLVLSERLKTIPFATLSLHKQMLSNLDDTMDSIALQLLTTEEMRLESIEAQLLLLDPSNVLDRGYALVKQAGKYVLNKQGVSKKENELEIQFRDGTLKVKQK